MTSLSTQGQRLSKAEQRLDDHLTECHEAAERTRMSIDTLTHKIEALEAAMRPLADLTKMGMGVVGALTVFGSLLIWGIQHWIESIVRTVK